LDVSAPLAAEEEGLLAQPRAGQNQEYAAQLFQNISSRYYFFQCVLGRSIYVRVSIFYPSSSLSTERAYGFNAAINYSE
jgi:hypothetical protein